MAFPSSSSSSRRRAVRHRRRRILAITLILVVVALGIGAFAVSRGDDTKRQRAVTTTTSTTTTTLPPVTLPPRDPVRGSGQPVTFAFGGDVHFEGQLRTKLLANPDTVLAPIAPVLSSADLAIVNLETAITERGTAADKEYVFRVPASALDALKAGGVDVASQANNHGLDYGPDGLADSLAARRDKQFPVIGIGANATEAYAPYRVEIKGQRIAVIAATDVLESAYVGAWTATDTQGGLASAKDLDRLLGAVGAARADSDTVVVYLHWGVENATCPNSRQQQLAQDIVAAGADIVVGSHAHRLQGAGRLGNAFVAYGLGNFVFYNEAGEAGRSGVLQVTATGHAIDSYTWTPARLTGGVATPLSTGAASDQALSDWQALQVCAGVAP